MGHCRAQRKREEESDDNAHEGHHHRCDRGDGDQLTIRRVNEFS
jgi:hypothetical protein